MGHAAFIGVGAYATAIGLESGILIFSAPRCHGCATAVFATVTGILALRTSGVYFPHDTLAFGQMVFFTLTPSQNTVVMMV